MKTHVLYHAGCWDGFGARYAYELAHDLGREEPAEYVPVAYGKPLDMTRFEEKDRVFILDFSYTRAELDALAAKVAHLEVHDHHATAEKELAGAPYATFDMNESGASLAWDRFHPEDPRPPIIRYVRARDLWRFADEDRTEEVIAWMRSHPLDFETWEDMDQRLRMDLDNVIGAGAAILRSHRQQVEAMSRHHGWARFDDFVVPFANATTLYSEVGQRLCEAHPEAAFAAYFTLRTDGTWQWGLRGNGKVHLGNIAKAHGGGGHPDAAGFVEPAVVALGRLQLPPAEWMAASGCGRPCPKIMESMA